MFRRSYSTVSNGLKVATKDSEGYLSKLFVKVNAGSRYADKDGVSHLLSRFNFQNTSSKSALRFARESELLGGFYNSQVTRDHIILSATFQKQDLPYFVNSLADIVSSTQFKPHEFSEVVLPTAKHDNAVANTCAKYQATEALHALVFKNGLARPVLYDGVSTVTVDDVKNFAAKAYNKSNIEIIGSGVNESALTKFLGESSFQALSEGAKLSDEVSLYSGEARIRTASGNAAAIGVAIKPEEFGLYETVATYLTETTGATASVFKYNGVGLFRVVVADKAPEPVSAAIKSIVSTLESGVKLNEYADLTKARLSVESEESLISEEPTVSNISDFSLGKFSYAALGNTSALPYADEL